MHQHIGPQNIVGKRGAIGWFRTTIVPFRVQFGHFRKDIVRYRPISCESEQIVQRPPLTPEMLPSHIPGALFSASVNSGFEKETWEIGAAAIREWMMRNNPESFAMPATSGYQWKQVLLPNGTLLRTIFNGKNFHCLVEEDHIRYNGQLISPSGFANAVGGVRRNAWKVIWKLAGALRTKKNTHRFNGGSTKSS
jgi:hypothetical protein